jgi:hypothetical protein
VTVALYLSDLAQGCKVSTLTRRIATISQAHQAAHLETPTKAAEVRAVMQGIRLFANHIEPHDVLDKTFAGTQRIRGWAFSSAERYLADAADELAHRVVAAERDLVSTPHGNLSTATSGTTTYSSVMVVSCWLPTSISWVSALVSTMSR